MQEEKMLKERITRLIDAIASCGISLKEISRISKIPYPSLRDYSKGVKKPGLDAFASLIEACNVSADWVLFGKKKNKAINEQAFGLILSLVEIQYLTGSPKRKPKLSALLEEVANAMESDICKEEILRIPIIKDHIEALKLDAYDKGLIAAITYNALDSVNMDDEKNVNAAKNLINYALLVLEEREEAKDAKSAHDQ